MSAITNMYKTIKGAIKMTAKKYFETHGRIYGVLRESKDGSSHCVKVKVFYDYGEAEKWLKEKNSDNNRELVSKTAAEKLTDKAVVARAVYAIAE